jgi:hypothetical protein
MNVSYEELLDENQNLRERNQVLEKRIQELEKLHSQPLQSQAPVLVPVQVPMHPPSRWKAWKSFATTTIGGMIVAVLSYALG